MGAILVADVSLCKEYVLYFLFPLTETHLTCFEASDKTEFKRFQNLRQLFQFNFILWLTIQEEVQHNVFISPFNVLNE